MPQNRRLGGKRIRPREQRAIALAHRGMREQRENDIGEHESEFELEKREGQLRGEVDEKQLRERVKHEGGAMKARAVDVLRLLVDESRASLGLGEFLEQSAGHSRRS